MSEPVDVTVAVEHDGVGFRLAGASAEAVRTLDAAVWETIIEHAYILPRSSHLSLTFVVPGSDIARAASLTEAVRLYFAHRRARSEYDLRRALHDGRSSLLLGGLLLIVLLSLVQAIDGLATTHRAVAGIQEGLTIVGWVALWRPAELLLYSPWTLRREIALFRRLENANVTVQSK